MLVIFHCLQIWCYTVSPAEAWYLNSTLLRIHFSLKHYPVFENIPKVSGQAKHFIFHILQSDGKVFIGALLSDILHTSSLSAYLLQSQNFDTNTMLMRSVLHALLAKKFEYPTRTFIFDSSHSLGPTFSTTC